MELTFIHKNNGSIYVIDVDILLSGGEGYRMSFVQNSTIVLIPNDSIIAHSIRELIGEF